MNTVQFSVTPTWLKWAYTAFMAVLVPVYWHHYGPTNFLYFCDVALFLTLAGIWLERPLLISMAAVGILAPQLLWLLDFFVGLAGGHLTGLTDYMFDANRSLFLRGLSLFHGWLPVMLLYLVWRAGYDTRGFAAWTALSWALVLVCYFFMPGPSPDHGLTPANINYVHGFEDERAQTWMHPYAWLALEMTAMPLVLFWPIHALLKRLDARRAEAPAPAALPSLSS
jgi:hypothetical protein